MLAQMLLKALKDHNVGKLGLLSVVAKLHRCGEGSETVPKGYLDDKFSSLLLQVVHYDSSCCPENSRSAS